MPPCVTGRRSRVRRTVTRVVSRIGIASTSSGSTMPVSVAPAVVQLEASASEASPKPITWLPESPMKTTALRPGLRLNGRKPTQAPPSASARTSRELARVLRDRIDGEHGAGDRRERRGQPVHVVEQVERVRDPDQPDDAEDGREHVRVDDLDRQPRSEDDSGGGELRRELRDRAEREEVVDEAGDEEHGATSEDPRELAACVGAESRPPRATPATSPRKIPTPPNTGVARSCQRSPDGVATSRSPTRVRSRPVRTSAATENAAIAATAFMRRTG